MILAANLHLDRVERLDPLQGLGGDGGRAGRGQLEELPAHVRPAEGQPNLRLFGQGAIAAVTVDLQ